MLCLDVDRFRVPVRTLKGHLKQIMTAVTTESKPLPLAFLAS